MSQYNKHTWVSGEVITAQLLNNIEDQLKQSEDEIQSCTDMDNLGYMSNTTLNSTGTNLVKSEGWWDFNSHTTYEQSGRYYLKYTISPGEKFIYITAVQASSNRAGYGFYSSEEPSTETLILKSNYSDDTSIGDPSTGNFIKVMIPKNAAYLYINIGVESNHRGIRKFIEYDAKTVLTDVDAALKWKGAISSTDNLNDILDLGIYRGTISHNNPNCPLSGAGLYSLIVFKYINNDTSTSSGARAQIVWSIGKDSCGEVLYRYLPSYNPNAGQSPVWTPWMPFNQIKKFNYLKAMTYEPFLNTTGLPERYRICDVAYGDGNLYIGVYYYEDAINYRIIKKPLTVRLDRLDGTETTHDILINNAAINKSYQIQQMIYFDHNLYITLYSSSQTQNPKSYLIKMSEDLSTTTVLYSWASNKISSIRIDENDGQLLATVLGDEVYLFDTQNSGNPPILVTTDTDKNWRHGAFYTITGQVEGKNIIVCAGSSGIYSYQITDNGSEGTQITPLFDWNDLGSGLQTYAVEVDYPYVYITVSPTNAQRKIGNNTMGIITLKIVTNEDDELETQKVGFSAIPQGYTGDWAARMGYDSATGTFSYEAVGDVAPTFIRKQGNYLYTTNENAGIAVFRITSPSDNTTRILPSFIGNIETGTWNRYFDIHDKVIFAGGDLDYINSQRPKVVAVSTILEDNS